MRDELELNLKDLLLKILLRWRFIVVCILTSGVLFGLLGAYKNSTKEIVGEEQEDVATLQKQAEELEMQLTDMEANMVKVAVDVNVSYQNQYEYLVEYMDNSILMKLNSQEVPTLKKMYQITGNDIEVEECSAIASAYTWILDSEDVYKEIVEKNNLVISEEYARELIKISEETDGAFTVTVMATDDEHCQQIIEVIDNKLIEIYQKMQELYGEFTLSELESKCSNRVLDEVLTKQQTVRSTFLGLNSKIQALDDSFSEKQLLYYDVLLKIQTDEETINSENVVSEEAQEISLINVKYILIGLFLGAVLGCSYIVVIYVFSSFLRKKDDLELVLGIPTLATIRTQTSKKKFLSVIDKSIYSIFNGKETETNAVENVCVNIRMITKKKQIKKVYLVGTYYNSEIEKFKETVCKELSADLEIKCGQFCENNVQDLEEMLNSDMVILFEQTGFSKNANIQRVVDICEVHKIHIGGSVVFDSY